MLPSVEEGNGSYFTSSSSTGGSRENLQVFNKISREGNLNISLRDWLEKDLTSSSVAVYGRIFVQVLTDYCFESPNEDFHRQGIPGRERLAYRHLILLYQQTSKGSSSEDGLFFAEPRSPGRRHGSNYGQNCNNVSANVYGSSVLVLGLTALEYAKVSDGRMARAYIQHLDSTGMYQPRRAQGRLTRALVKAYIRYAIDQLGVQFLHVYASAQPSLLFGGSERSLAVNGGTSGRKRPLDGKTLVAWWLALLHQVLNWDVTVACRASIWAPADGASLAGSWNSVRIMTDRLSNNETGIQWHYEIPYDLEGSSSSIPLFEDDPKFRHWEAVCSDEGPREDATTEQIQYRSRKRMKRSDGQQGMPVAEFFATLAYRQEFSRPDPTAFIRLRFLKEDQSVLVERPRGRVDWASFALKMLQMVSFETDNENFRASTKIATWLRLAGAPGPFQIAISEQFHEGSDNSPEDLEFRALMKTLLSNDSTETKARAAFLPSSIYSGVQDLTGLIKRKVPK